MTYLFLFPLFVKFEEEKRLIDLMKEKEVIEQTKKKELEELEEKIKEELLFKDNLIKEELENELNDLSEISSVYPKESQGSILLPSSTSNLSFSLSSGQSLKEIFLPQPIFINDSTVMNIHFI